MPRPVCVKCKREMRITKAAIVQFNANSVGGAYEQWSVDIAECEGCGSEVACRYAHDPLWRHHYKDGPVKDPFVIVEERRG